MAKFTQSHYEMIAREIGGTIGRAVIRATRHAVARQMSEPMRQSNWAASILKAYGGTKPATQYEVVRTERGRIEGARTVAVGLAWQFAQDNERFNRERFLDAILSSAQQMAYDEMHSARYDAHSYTLPNYYLSLVAESTWSYFGDL